ncbi:MAG: EI24 domain-containing protein [Alphaproteobacteria bacterium]
MIVSFLAALRQLNDPPIRAVLWRVALWTAAAFATLAWALVAAVSGIDAGITLDFIPWDWLREPLAWFAGVVVAVIGGFLFIAALWLLFAALVQFVGSFYLERVIAAVEARHYPRLPAPTPPAPGDALAAALRFFGALVAFNALALPVYLVPTVGLVAFYLVNGYLLGREYFEMVAQRRIDADAMRSLRKAHRGRLLGFGLIITILISLPLVNLAAPIIAAAAMVHVYAGMSEGEAIVHAGA